MKRSRLIRGVTPEARVIENRDTANNSNIHRRSVSRHFSRRTVITPLASQNIPKTTKPSDRSGSNKVTYSPVDRLWEGETIYIIGGGPSLKNFNFMGLVGSRVIAVNKAMYAYPNADVLFWTDSRFYTWYKNDIDNFQCLKYTLKSANQYTADVKILRKGAPHGLEEGTDTLAHGNNSGYAAINLAYHLGAKRIVLLGFDMCNDGIVTHFHDGYPTRATGDRIYVDKFLPGFTSLYECLKQKGVEVLNASPYSKLTVFTKISLEAAVTFR